MMNVIEELTESHVDRAYVERRVDDWIATIHRLYADVKGWLPSGWRAWEDGTLSMHEELMKRFGLPERRLPLLRMEGPLGRRGWMEPRGLWIIGANGRIDMIVPPQHFLLINREDSFEPQRWRISTLEDRTRERLLSRDTFSELFV